MKRIKLVAAVTILFMISLPVFAALEQVNFYEGTVIDLIERISLISPYPYGIGWSVTSGDFNGDGLSDAVASGHSNGVCLYYGNNEVPTTPDQILTDPSGEGGFGFFVTSAGDVNNDGFDELIVAKDRGTEMLYLYMGTSQGLSNTPDIILTPPSGYSPTSFIVLGTSSGDINGDGFTDILAWGSDIVDYFCIYYGSPSGLESSTNFSFAYPEDERFANVSTIGDINNDGFDDFAVANYPPTQGFWKIHIYHGSSNGNITDPKILSIYNSSPFLFLIVQLTSAGDLNGDGFSDLLIGCQGADGIYVDEGKAYIYYGSSEGLSDSPDVIIDSPYPRQHDGFGESVDGIGDFNFDGYDDIVIGCPYGHYASIYNGSSDGVSNIPSLTLFESGWLGWSASHVGDMKGNGQNFIIVGEEFDNAHLYAHKDSDLDGIIDFEDNCPYVGNPDQVDYDEDGVGDYCDNCPYVTNPGQEDTDGDGIGDVCDECTDTDDDGFGNSGFPSNTCDEDNCPYVTNPSQEDTDGDGIGDVCDNCFDVFNPAQEDVDDDGVGNVCDNCPEDDNPDQEDYDSDGLGDICDPDYDGDGICNPGQSNPSCSGTDNCLYLSNPDQEDTDGDGFGDVCDDLPYIFNPIPIADGHYYNLHSCDLDDWYFKCYCSTTTGVDNRIYIRYFQNWPFYCYGDAVLNAGIMEFDISRIDGFYTSGQIESVLTLTVENGSLSNDRCLSLYNIKDVNENGVLEEVDVDTEGFIGEICEDLQAGNIITFDVTSALKHDLFDPDQTNFSGFVIDRSTEWEDSIEFYDHTDFKNGPRLSIVNLEKCTSHSDCADRLFCNGAERCIRGKCRVGSNPCFPYLLCNEDEDVCVECLHDVDCYDGFFCSGLESCVDGTCQPGTPRCQDDGDFCNGEESCDEENKICLPGGNPCSEPTPICDEEDDICTPATPLATILLTPQTHYQSRWLPLPIFIAIAGSGTHFNRSSSVTFIPSDPLVAVPLIKDEETIFLVGFVMPSLLAPYNFVDVMVTTVSEEVYATITLELLSFF